LGDTYISPTTNNKLTNLTQFMFNKRVVKQPNSLRIYSEKCKIYVIIVPCPRLCLEVSRGGEGFGLWRVRSIRKNREAAFNNFLIAITQYGKSQSSSFSQ